MTLNVICCCGMKNCGKDYQANPYIKEGYLKISFADSLREMLWDILGYTPNKEFNYDQFKQSNFTAEISCKILGFIPWIKDVNITSGRKLLQNLGSVIKKWFGKDIFAKLWYNKVLEANCNVIATDIRFDYEFKKAISLSKKGYNVKFIWCCYHGADFENILKDTHESELLAQFMYKNRKKYNLVDGEIIDLKIINKILKDFNKITIK